MATQQRALTAIKGEKLVYNYGVRQLAPGETRRMDHVKNLRRVELTEQLLAIETEQKAGAKRGP